MEGVTLRCGERSNMLGLDKAEWDVVLEVYHSRAIIRHIPAIYDMILYAVFLLLVCVFLAVCLRAKEYDWLLLSCSTSQSGTPLSHPLRRLPWNFIPRAGWVQHLLPSLVDLLSSNYAFSR